MDLLILFSEEHIPSDWTVITTEDLSKEELDEYNEQVKNFKDIQIKKNLTNSKFKHTLYRNAEMRGMIGLLPDFSFNKITSKLIRGDEETVNEAVPFVIIDKIPRFPGCDDNDKKCFNRKMQQHFAENFDRDMPNRLGLSSGKKRLIMLFNIDKKGIVSDVRVKAPDPKLEDEAKRVISLLPRMIPGENNGEIVSVKYTLPMRIDVK